MDGRLKQISHLCLDMTNKNLLLGTEGGNIYTLNLTSFSIEDSIIYQDIVIQNSTDEFKVNPGAVEALQVHPTDVDKLLIGKSWYFVTRIFLTYCEKRLHLVIEKNFWNSRLKVKNFQKFWDHWNNLFKQWKVRQFLTECFFNLFLEVSQI